MTPEESARYWAAKKAQHQRALDFLAEARPGDTYRIERYALPQTGILHELSPDADRHDKRVVTLYAVHRLTTLQKLRVVIRQHADIMGLTA